MPFQPGNKLGSHGNHARGFTCRNLKQLKNMRWIQKDGEAQRVPAEELQSYLDQGWVNGRPSPSEETRQKQSESGKVRLGLMYAMPWARRDAQYKVRYKRTIEDFNLALLKQGGHCALCESIGSEKRRLCWDHDHKCCEGWSTCGKCVRGLLCIACNKKMGHLEEFMKSGTIVPTPGTWTANAMAYIASYATPTPPS